MPTFIKADGDASGSNRIGLGRPLDAVRRRLPERVRKDDPTSQRCFPPPWTVEEYNDACFIVRDHSGQALALC
jgi:hypothetical protein